MRHVVRVPQFPIPVNPPDRRAGGGDARRSRSRGPNSYGWIEVRQNPAQYSFTLPDTGTTIAGAAGFKERLRIRESDNDSCVWEGERDGGFSRGEWRCRVFSSFRLTSTRTDFFVEETVRASYGDATIFERSNKRRVPRDLM